MARRRPRLINTARFLTPPERQIIDNARVLLPQWRCVAPLALVQPGADDLKIEVVLRKSFDRILGRYTCRWSSLVEHNPRILDMDNTLEKFRETFYIVSNLPDLDEVNAAFAVLNATLDTFPQLLRENHPELLFSLVELAYGLSMPNFCALHAKIKPHVAEMASVILGSDHPFTVLLRMEFVEVLRSHVTEVVFKCITDCLCRTFGDTAYQTLVHQFGRSQFYARTGQGEKAEKIIGQVLDRWKCLYGPDSILARLVELECNLLRLQRHQGHYLSLEVQINNIMCRIESISGVHSTKFTDKLSSDFQSTSRTTKYFYRCIWHDGSCRISATLLLYTVVTALCSVAGRTLLKHHPL